MRTQTLLPALLVLGLTSHGTGQSANEAAAMAEMNTMAQQMSLVLIDTTYLTTLENLDDLSSQPGDPANSHNWINDQGGALVIDPQTGRFEGIRVDLVNRPPSLQWQGPYITYQQGRVDDEMSDYDRGTPLDPWGTPYFFYSPVGLIHPKQQTVTLQDYGDAFDMYTLVSFGADRAKGTDDLFFQFYGSVAVPTISSVRIEAASSRQASYVARLKGYGFGAVQGTGEVEINGEQASNVEGWSSTLILVELDALPPEGAPFVVRTDGGADLSFTGYLLEGVATVDDWELY